MPSLDPQHLTPSASLNRVRIVDLPGLSVDPEVRGRTGFELVSVSALAELVRQHATALELDPTGDGHELLRALDHSLGSQDAAVRTTAESVGRRIGRNLGYILLTPKRGDPVNRAARGEWDDSYWEHWAGIRRVWLGGGMVSGRLGPILRDHALKVMWEGSCPDYTIRLSPYAAVLPLVGAARYAPSTCQTAVVFDFGSTLIKCAYASYRDGVLTELRCLPPQLTGWEQIERSSQAPAERATRLLDRIVAVITTTWRSAGRSLTGPILASVAAYVQDGHPMLAQGGAYYQLRHVTDHLQTALAQRVSDCLGKLIAALLLHDGTAAATAYAGMENTAVVMLGTALGIGFPSYEQTHLRPIGTDFRVLALDRDGAL
jgi:hypothetical protein